jgi:hypothetical protein
VAALPFVPVLKQRSGLRQSSMVLAKQVKRFMITYTAFFTVPAMLT